MREPIELSRRQQGKPRRVSISELPRLSRASTLDIELHYLKLYIRHRRKHIAESLGPISKAIIKILKRTTILVVLLPLLPCALFFIAAERLQEYLGDGDDGIKLGKNSR